MNVAIIGGGASGVLAALRIKQNNPNIDVTIFEKNNKILKKVAATGNGRCNLSNEEIDASKYQNPTIFHNFNYVILLKKQTPTIVGVRLLIFIICFFPVIIRRIS